MVMREHIVKILSIEQETHDVKRFLVEKPAGYSFTPGQATDVSIKSRAAGKEKRSFSFTCLNSFPYLEFIVKIYPERKGMTYKLGKLQPGDELIIREAYGSIKFKGKGVFIAGGTGVTPFISMLRELHRKMK
jgi:ferredoxin-NADP reductase